MKVKDILVRGLKTISSDSSMIEAEKMLTEGRIRHLPVIEGKEIIGIISDRDINRARTVVRSQDKTEMHIQSYKKVSDYMTTPVLKLNESVTVEHLTREMIRLKISSFIIEDDSARPVGIITTEDLLLVLLDKLNAPHPLKVLKKFFKGYSD